MPGLVKGPVKTLSLGIEEGDGECPKPIGWVTRHRWRG